MGYVLLVYSRAAYAEYPLPCRERGEVSLEQARFALPEGLRLAFGYENGWPVFLPGPYTVRSQDGQRDFPLPARPGALYFLSPAFGGQLILAVREINGERPPASRAYRLDGETSIGSLPENHIIYSGSRAVSGIHAVVLPDAGGYRLENRSSNGTYVNQKRLSAALFLSPGDRIHIFGLDILYRDGCVVLDAGTPGLRIHEKLAAAETVPPTGGFADEEETVWEGTPDSEAETVLEGTPDAGEETVLERMPEEETVFEGALEEETVLEGTPEEETVFEGAMDSDDETVFE